MTSSYTETETQADQNPGVPVNFEFATTEAEKKASPTLLEALRDALRAGPKETIGYGPIGVKAFHHGWNSAMESVWGEIIKIAPEMGSSGAIRVPNLLTDDLTKRIIAAIELWVESTYNERKRYKDAAETEIGEAILDDEEITDFAEGLLTQKYITKFWAGELATIHAVLSFQAAQEAKAIINKTAYLAKFIETHNYAINAVDFDQEHGKHVAALDDPTDPNTTK